MADKASFTLVSNAFRWYEDGSEDGSTPVENQDIDISGRDLDGGDSQLHLRWRVDETGGADGAVTDDYAMEFDRNSSGSWTVVTTSSSYVQVDTASTLVDGDPTTNRATNGISDPGSGSFDAGEQEDGDGEITNLKISASNFSELVFAIKLIAADLSNGDDLDFRLTLNGGTPGMTNNVEPGVSVSKTPTANVPGAMHHYRLRR